jgi:hypothetical protein
MIDPVLTLNDINTSLISQLTAKFNLQLTLSDNDKPIPGSFWGESEAGLIENKLYVRMDTPIHSLLHEGCHYICMDEQRRSHLDTDAAGDYDEENAVCYLQILLADHIEGVGSNRLMQDMDSWGYTFRLGSTKAWFEKDADDAKQWLIRHRIIDLSSQPTYKLRIQ